MTYEDILEDFPQLTMEHIFAVFSFLADRERVTQTVAS